MAFKFENQQDELLLFKSILMHLEFHELCSLLFRYESIGSFTWIFSEMIVEYRYRLFNDITRFYKLHADTIGRKLNTQIELLPRIKDVYLGSDKDEDGRVILDLTNYLLFINYDLEHFLHRIKNVLLNSGVIFLHEINQNNEFNDSMFKYQYLKIFQISNEPPINYN